MASFLGCAANKGKSALNATHLPVSVERLEDCLGRQRATYIHRRGLGLSWFQQSHLLFLPPLSPCAVHHGRSSSYPIPLTLYASFSAFAHPGAVPVLLSLLRLLSGLSSLLFVDQWVEDAPPRSTIEQRRRMAVTGAL
jgi:hypothetical protein